MVYLIFNVIVVIVWMFPTIVFTNTVAWHGHSYDFVINGNRQCIYCYIFQGILQDFSQTIRPGLSMLN